MTNFQSLTEMQRESCILHANRPIYGTKIKGEWRWIQYHQFARYVDEIRGGLNHLGFEEKGTIAIISRNCVEWAIIAYACYGLRGRIVAMYESQSSDEWEYILKDSGATFVFVQNSVVHDVIERIKKTIPTIKKVINFQDEDADHLSFDALMQVGQYYPAPVIHADFNDIMAIIYTSGTTDKPKGVLLSHGNILSQVISIKQRYKFTPDDRTLSFLPWAHIFGQTGEVHLLIALGFSSAFAESTGKISVNMTEIKPTMLLSVPQIFNRIFETVHTRIQNGSTLTKLFFRKAMSTATKKREGKACSAWDTLSYFLADAFIFKKIRASFGGRLQYAISGGAALQIEVASFLDSLGITVYEGYGLSETSPLVSSNFAGAIKLGTTGKVLEGVSVVIDCAVGDSERADSGEIVVYGPNVMQGYHNLPEETARVLTEDGGFRTGDLGYLDADGFLTISGRVKEQFKLQNGKWVIPSMIEDRLNLNHFVANALVFGQNREFTICVIDVKLEKLVDYTSKHGIFSLDHNVITKEEIIILLSHSKVQQLFQSIIDEQCRSLRSFEKPKGFLLTGDVWNAENGFLTQTFKLRRIPIISHYAEAIDSLYHQPKSFFDKHH